MDHERRLLDAAGDLFYRRGIQAVGMDEIRAASGVSLKRLYQCFPSKEALVVAYLRRRDERWLSSLTAHVADAPREERVPAVFGWLERWFAEDDFRGCGFLNAYAELGAGSEAVRAAVREHKERVRGYLRSLAEETAAADPDLLAGQLLTLVDGATVTAMVSGDPGAARTAALAATALVRARTH
ncbi:MAG: TetR/AcrR family transcriptional regulator [Nonomuraea sp.]|nr:TetR/AcrR family transcriptional regulator [Nonomuraea sp.]NUS03923.1 TetR/AcrR family transcriptional regulator [Nonomuraea sp.]NUT41846.1 TetR/AcrR family transcriptional regulator [Thermoactinospora sp.]